MKIGTSISIGLMVAGCWLATGVAGAAPPSPGPAPPPDPFPVPVGTELPVPVKGGLPELNTELEFIKKTLGRCPATGQESCWDSNGDPIACAGTGQDGDVRAGAVLSYTDNGDGTITDNNTKLMWEKKDNSIFLPMSSVHDKDNVYTWGQAFVFIDALNNTCNGEGVTVCDSLNECGAGEVCGFAGFRDWRLPNVKELIGIVNYENETPAVSEAFNSGCVPGCTLESCSCIAGPFDFYWSSTSSASVHGVARGVGFTIGHVGSSDKDDDNHVRAVRGGL